MNSMLSVLFLLLLSVVASGLNKTDIAVIVCTGNFHYEVMAFFVHHLQALNMTVLPYHLDDGPVHRPAAANMNNLIRPIAGHVDYLKTHNTSNIPATFKVLVYVTMVWDIPRTCRFGLHDILFNRAERVVMVNHHASTIYQLHAVCTAPKCTVFNIAPHVQETVLGLLAERNISDCKSRYAYALFDHSLPDHIPIALVKLQKTFTNATRLIAIQGNIELTRRRYDLLFACMADIRNTSMDLRLLNVGHKKDSFTIPSDVSPYITVLADLPFDQFYSTLRQAEVLVAFTNTEMHYEANRSSSSIPTALVNKMPIVLPKQLLKVYDCLHAAPIHQRIALEDDCSSLKAALALSVEERAEMRAEVDKCRTQWLAEGTQVLREIMEEDVPATAPIRQGHCNAVGNRNKQMHDER